MKWFKHDSNAQADAKMRKLISRYGATGYAIYWRCLEYIAAGVEKHNITFELEHDAEILAGDFALSVELVESIMGYMIELKLFENSDGRITCMKMMSRTDEYTQKIIKQRVTMCPDSVPTKSVLIEEKRTEEKRKEKKRTDTTLAGGECVKRFDQFWQQYPKKVGKQQALKAFLKLDPDEKLQSTIIKAIMANKESEAWIKEKGRFIPHASTWLAGERWDDEIASDDGEQDWKAMLRTGAMV